MEIHRSVLDPMPYRAWLFIAAFGLAFTGSGHAKDDVIGPIEAPQEIQQQATEEPAIEPAPIANVAPTNRASDEHNQGAAAESDKEPEQLPYVVLGIRGQIGLWRSLVFWPSV